MPKRSTKGVNMDLAYIIAGCLILMLPAINHGISELRKSKVEYVKEYYENNVLIKIERSYHESE